MRARESRQVNTAVIAVIGGLIVTLALVLTTVWMGRSAGKDSEEAVRTVSLLYLDELAGRREQVVAENLKDRIFDMRTALDLMTEEDLQDEAHRQAYQKKMKALFILEKFAFVDTEGHIYTSVGVQDDIDQYQFDHLSISGAEISLKNLEGSDKKVIIAMPVDLMSEGKHLIASFMEIDMKEMLSGVSMQAQEGGATFCNIYTKTGVALSNTVLGGLAVEGNLLEAMKQATYGDGYSYEKFITEFRNGQRGVVSFTYNGIRETLSYIPVEGTDWLLTYLIRESVISEQISSISNGIIRRSILQSILTVVILISIFAYLIYQTRKNSQLRLERETSDAENRVKQQELEQRLVLQEKLLEEEKQRTQADQMITAMASDYRSVYYVDIDADDAVCYRAEENDPVQIPEGAHFPYHARFAEYGEKHVAEEYREGFLRFVDPQHVKEALASESIIVYRYLARRNGKEYYEMLRMAGVRHPEDRDDHIVHAVGVGFTVIDTEMRENMQRNQTLAEALKAAEEANKAKTAFLSNMSHEIRTPMNAIIGLDNIALNDSTISDTTREYLEKIGTSARHLLGIINDILDMSRIESGRMTIKSEEFSFAKALAQVNTIISGQCRDKGIEYDCHVNGKVDDYYIGDDMKLRQVMINILGNAVKFTPEGGKVSFTVDETARFDGKSTLRFIISDTGIGMSKEYLPKIFDAFSQEDSSSTNKYGSTGLGMPITKSIVELMNGRIEVESEKGVGTTFTVTVTLLESKMKENEKQTGTIQPHDMCVLVIDDDPIACEHAQVVLGQVGISCEKALSGTEGLEMVKLRQARMEPYNLILVDWKMPDMDGVETTRQIRKVVGNATPVIILTSYSWDDIADEAKGAGVDTFVAKPLFAGNVLDEFREAFTKKNEQLAQETADLKGRRVLLAEDVAVNAEIMMMVLSMREMEADLAENGRIAVEKFAQSEPGYYDAILMDMRMPEMDGLEATRTIRALEREDAKTIPIIALTANAFDEDVQRSMQAGLNAHLSKPVEPEALFKTLEGLIKP
ncbi:MAG: response regulator [Clostridia bacterium]|nr:response regulator [Clostridia bacterium]